MHMIEVIAALPEVASINEWNGRFYVNLANTSRSAKGDSRKIWIKGDTLTLESYKGYMSDGAIASLSALEDKAAEIGMKIVR